MAPIASPRTRRRARLRQLPGPVSTIHTRPPANTAVQASARLGVGIGDAVPQSRTRSASGASSADVSRPMRSRTMRWTMASWTPRDVNTIAPAATTTRTSAPRIQRMRLGPVSLSGRGERAVQRWPRRLAGVGDGARVRNVVGEGGQDPCPLEDRVEPGAAALRVAREERPARVAQELGRPYGDVRSVLEDEI